MADNLQFVLMGVGSVGGIYVRALKDIPDAELVGVIDLVPEKLEVFAEEHTIAHKATDLKSMADQVDFDAVIVATPTGVHGECTEQAAALGKHVLCEKPLEITLEKIDDMIEACRDAGVTLGRSYQYRTATHNQAARAAIQAGKLGKIYIADAFLKWWRGQEYYDSSAWRGTWELDGGGPFIQQAAHTVDILVWLMGRPKKVTAWTRTVAHNLKVEDMGHAIVEYENGAQGIIEASTVVKPGFPTRIEIHGEKGSIILGESEIIAWDVEGVEPPAIERNNIITGATDPTGIGTKNHERIIRDFIQAIHEGREPMVDPASARTTSELIAAIYKSSREAKAVQL